MTVAIHTQDDVEEVRHRIEGSVKLLGSVANIDVLPLLNDVQRLACMAMDVAEETPEREAA